MNLLAFILIFIVLFTGVPAVAEVKTLTLRQALDLALAQNPDLLISRLNQQRARAQVSLMRDPFLPKLTAATGAAFTSGYPTSIDGNPPSIIQGKFGMGIFNRPQTLLVAQAREGVRTSSIETTRTQDEILYRVAATFLDAEQVKQSLQAVQRQGVNLARVRELTEQRVTEGRELPLESKKASIAVLRANQRVEMLSMDLANAESALGQILGLGPQDSVKIQPEERQPLVVPESEEASIETALGSSNELKSLQSSMQAKTLEIKSYQAAKLPRVEFFTQYSMLAKHNYEDFFRRFQRNNEQVGAAIEIPLIVARAASAQQTQAEVDVAKLRVEVSRTRSRIASDLRRAYQDLRRAESMRDLARADLDVTREELTVRLAQMDEGRLPLAAVEASRAVENEKWLAYYEAQHASAVARLNVLRQTGTLAAALR